jgi:hypothetical protein
MRTSSSFLLALVLAAACTAPPQVGRAPLVPPLDQEMPKADLSRDQGTRAAADLSPPVPMQDGELPSRLRELPPTYRTVVHVVETPVYVEVPGGGDVAGEGSYTPHYAEYIGFYRDVDRRHRRWREPFFPVHTAVGAGIGAIIGHQSGHRDRGALIGGSIGLARDLGRWWRW